MSKSKLNEYCQRSHISAASYSTTKEGDLFVSEVTVRDGRYQSVNAHETKKEAEQDAAAVALQALLQLHPAARGSVDGLLASLGKKKGSAKLASSEQHVVCPTTTKVVSSAATPHTPPMAPVTPPPRGPAMLVGSPPPISYVRLPATNGGYPSPQARSPEVHQALVRPLSMPLGVVGPPVAQVFVPSFAYAPRGGGIQHGIPVPFSAPLCPIPPAAGSSVVGPQSRPTIPASPHQSGNIPHASPTSLNSVPSNQRPDNGLHKDNTSSVTDLEKELNRYCTVRGLRPPMYSIRETSGRFSGKVVVNGVEYVGSSDQASFELAKKSAAVFALARIGLEALKLEEEGIAI